MFPKRIVQSVVQQSNHAHMGNIRQLLPKQPITCNLNQSMYTYNQYGNDLSQNVTNNKQNYTIRSVVTLRDGLPIIIIKQPIPKYKIYDVI